MLTKCIPLKVLSLTMWGKEANCMWEYIWSYFIEECYSFACCVPTCSEHINEHYISCWQCFVWNSSICKTRRNIIFTFSVFFIKKKKLLQCGLSCASTGDIFDESTVEVYVKTDFENFSWVVQQAENRLLSISSFSFWFFHWFFSLSKFICYCNKNSSLSPIPTSLNFLRCDGLITK